MSYDSSSATIGIPVKGGRESRMSTGSSGGGYMSYNDYSMQQQSYGGGGNGNNNMGAAARPVAPRSVPPPPPPPAQSQQNYHIPTYNNPQQPQQQQQRMTPQQQQQYMMAAAAAGSSHMDRDRPTIIYEGYTPDNTTTTNTNNNKPVAKPSTTTTTSTPVDINNPLTIPCLAIYSHLKDCPLCRQAIQGSTFMQDAQESKVERCVTRRILVAILCVVVVIGLFILPTIIQSMYNRIFSKKDTNAPPQPTGGSNPLPILHPPRTGGYAPPQQHYRPQQQTHLYPQHPQHQPQ